MKTKNNCLLFVNRQQNKYPQSLLAVQTYQVSWLVLAKLVLFWVAALMAACAWCFTGHCVTMGPPHGGALCYAWADGGGHLLNNNRAYSLSP